MNHDIDTTTNISPGTKPSLLVRQYHTMAEAGMGLDLHCGAGADCLFLAQKDFTMIGLDSNPAQIEKALHNASKSDLELDFQTADIEAFKFHKERYNIILANHLLQDYSNTAIADLCQKICYSLRKNGLIIGCGLNIDDPSCRELRKKNIPEIEPNSFQITPETIRTFLAPRQILELFPDYRIIYYAENEYYESGQPQAGWHGLTEFVLRNI